MAKQLNVALNFTANTTEAKARIKELNTQLNNLNASLTRPDLPITKEVNEAITATSKLKVALQQSMNVDTGKFDLSKFNQTLKKSGTSLSQLHSQLSAVGPDGRRAFLSLAQSIAAAEIPSKRMNSQLNEMWNTLKNSARWQISSSVLHSLQGAIQSAFNYAEDLNESLTNIRIVTGQSTDQMAKFAEKANQAAKALSTTTTKYTDAALIYYQQGLPDEDVQKRTDTTIKMANVTGENAENVSSYMTAIWNNFNDGSKSLEYYADVITKLGAETAASSEEIANGLEKFAAIGNTIGLSYEYATAALTTIIDKTRQSEDVVGTALKTIFARIQGLKVGETTEEGLDLNKYSKALNAYGIQIFDANNNLKDMDKILDDMGEKWQTLSRADKTALAQTVAGVRQYNQLISLMDNWESMKDNITSARDSEGTLQEQADIYAESWQAASDRVRAAIEEIFSDLIDDAFFIDLLNALEKILNFVDLLIDSAGGLKGVLLAISSIILKTFNQQIATGIQNMAYNFKSFTGLNKDEINNFKEKAVNLAQQQPSNDITDPVEKASLYVSEQRLHIQSALNEQESNLTEIQKEALKQQNEYNRLLGEQYKKAAQNNEVAKDELADLRQKHNLSAEQGYTRNKQQDEALIKKYQNSKNKYQTSRGIFNDVLNSFNGDTKAAEKYTAAIIKAAKAQDEFSTSQKNFNDDVFNQLDRIEEEANKIKQLDYSTIFINTLQSVSSLSMGITSLKSAVDTIQDPDLSAWEKFSSVSMSLSMGIPMLMNGLTSLGGVYDSLKVKALSHHAALLLSNKALENQTLQTTLNTISSKLNTAATNEQSRADLTKSITQELVNKGMEEETAVELANTIVTKGLTKATIAQIAANLGIQASLGPIIIILVAIAAAIGLVIGLINAHKNKINFFREDYEKTKNTLDAVTDSFENIKNAIKDVENTMENLGDKYSELEKLTKGTAEWRTKLQEINQEVQDIADEYHLIENEDYFRNSEGVKVFTDQGRAKIDAENERRMVEGSLAVSSADYEVKKAETKALKEEILYEEKYESNGQNLTEDEIENLLATLKLNPLLTLESAKDLEEAGISSRIAEQIASNKELQDAILKLRNATEENTEAYESKLEDSILQNSAISSFVYGEGSNIDQEYRSDLINQIAEDVKAQADQAASSKSISDGTDINQAVNDYMETYGIVKEGNKYYKKNEDGTANKEEEVSNVEASAIRWKETAIAIKKAESELEKYQKAVEKSKDVWAKAKTLQAGPWKELKEEISGATEATYENIQASEGYDTVKNTLVDMLDLNKEQADALDVKTIKQNLDLIDQAINGNADSLNELKKKFQGIKKDQPEILFDLGLVENPGDKIDSELQSVLDQLDDQIDDIKIGASADLSNLYPQLEEMVKNGKISAEKLQEYLTMKGFEGLQLEPIYEDIQTSAFMNFIHGKGWKRTTEKQFVGFKAPDGGIIRNSHGSTLDLGVEDTVIGESKLNDNKGTGINKTKKDGDDLKDKKRLKDEKERYHVIKEQIQSLNKEYDRLSAAKDRVWGANRVALIKSEREQVEKLIKAQDKYLKQINSNLLKDQANIASYGAKFDKYGNITNYDAIVKKQVNKFNKSRTEKAEKEYNQFVEVLKQYEETLDLKADEEQEKIGLVNQEQDLNYEDLTYRINLKLELNDDQLKELDYYFDKIEDDVYKAAEGFALLNQQVDTTKDALAIHENATQELTELYKAGKISQADYIEGIKEHKDAIYDNLKALQDYKKQLQEFYGKTLEKAQNELDKYTDRFDNLSRALEHYKNILKITGQEANYAKIGEVLSGSAKVAKDKMDTSAQWYEVQKQNLADLEAEYKRNHSETIKMALDAQREATAQAYDEMLSDAEEYAEALNEIYENEMAKLAKTLNKTLTGGLGFDRLKESMQNISEIQDEYLTKTNKVYEANKLLNNISNDINKTNNAASKQRLNNFSKEIEKLKQKDKLSNLELEIAQAKYKQLQAQIALEEAQNAKSTIRLSRDNEGNYGYIYTSDEEAISSAEQELMDAENNLYNIRLNAANEYAQKAIQAREELYEKLTEIDQRYEENTDEWKEARTAALQEYYDKINAYTDLYNIAQKEDSRIFQDAWSSAYSKIINDGGKWKTAVETYTTAADLAFQNWQTSMSSVTKLAGDDLLTLQGKVKDVTTESENLRKEVKDNVIPTLTEKIKKVKKEVTENAKLIDSLDSVETKYEDLCTTLQATITKYEGLETAALSALKAMSKVTGAQDKMPKADLSKDDKDDTKDKGPAGSKIQEDDGDSKVNIEPSGKYTVKIKWPGAISNHGQFSVTGTGKTRDEAIKDALALITHKEVKEKYLESVNRGVGGHAKNYPSDRKAAQVREKLNDFKKGILNHDSDYSKYITYLDTGGYTGKWGPEGKLAVLHEKELVLNQEDTNNLLKIIEIVRNAIDGNVATAGFGSLRAAGISTNNETLEQNVIITAEFPNATDHNEIEQAFDSLINRAAQFANRKK